MKSSKLLIIALLHCSIVLLFPLIGSSVFAQYRMDPKDIDFNIVPQIICAIIPGCNSSGGTPAVTPTPIPGSGPTGIPFPTANPVITPPPGACMPPGGYITCGTYNTPIHSCGHCNPRTNYPMAKYCKVDDTAYGAGGNGEAIDIAHQPLTSVPLPFLLGHDIIWYHRSDTFFSDGSDPYAAYQEYVGTDSTDPTKNYIIRYLHTQHQSGAPFGLPAHSGTEGAKVAFQYAKYHNKVPYPGNHIHIQIFDQRVNKWVEATNYYCH